MTLSATNTYATERGSSLFIVLIAVALFAALSYALSQGGNSARSLAPERVRLIASEVIDMGNKLADATARLRLRRVTDTHISFENTVVAGYTNATCTADSCKIFAFDGGGRDWERPAADVSSSEWGFTGGLAMEGSGTADADLVAVLPGLNYDVCDRINLLLGNYATGGSPISFLNVNANKFTGTYLGVPVTLTGAQILGKPAGCAQATAANGTAFTGAPLTDTYFFYQVLEAR